MWVRAFSFLVLGLVAGWLAARWFARAPFEPSGAGTSSERAAGPASAASVAAEQELWRELERLRKAVEELAATRPRTTLAPAPTNERVAAGAEAVTRAELLAAMDELEAGLLESLRVAQGAQPLAGAEQTELLERLRDPSLSPDWAAWQEILTLWDSDRDAARREVKLLAAEEVLERFGRPTDVWSNTNGITWQYARDWDPREEVFGLEIILRLPDGYVTQLAVRRP